MAKHYGYKLTGTPHACDSCNLVKSKAKAIPTATKTVVSTVGERVGLDISGPFPLTSGIKHRPTRFKLYWCAIIDHYSRKMLSSFKYTKSDLIDFVREAYSIYSARKHFIKCIRLDNAGENAAVAKFCQQHDITVEFTPPDTPKLNGIIERAFAIRWEKAKILI